MAVSLLRLKRPNKVSNLQNRKLPTGVMRGIFTFCLWYPSQTLSLVFRNINRSIFKKTNLYLLKLFIAFDPKIADFDSCSIYLEFRQYLYSYSSAFGSRSTSIQRRALALINFRRKFEKIYDL